MKKAKPIESDVHFKYLCDNCGQAHWLSLLEASTKNYKIVCFCKNVFSVKRIDTIKVLYIKNKKTTDTATKSPEKAKNINQAVLDKAVSALVNYGFTSTESKEYIENSYKNNPTDNYVELVKQTLAMMRT